MECQTKHSLCPPLPHMLCTYELKHPEPFQPNEQEKRTNLEDGKQIKLKLNNHKC